MKTWPLTDNLNSLDKNSIKYSLILSNYIRRNQLLELELEKPNGNPDNTFKGDVRSVLFVYKKEDFGPFSESSKGSLLGPIVHSERESLLAAVNAAIAKKWGPFEKLNFSSPVSTTQLGENSEILNVLKELEEIHVFSERAPCNFSKEPKNGDKGCEFYLDQLNQKLGGNITSYCYLPKFTKNSEAQSLLKKKFKELAEHFGPLLSQSPPLSPSKDVLSDNDYLETLDKFQAQQQQAAPSDHLAHSKDIKSSEHTVQSKKAESTGNLNPSNDAKSLGDTIPSDDIKSSKTAEASDGASTILEDTKQQFEEKNSYSDDTATLEDLELLDDSARLSEEPSETILPNTPLSENDLQEQMRLEKPLDIEQLIQRLEVLKELLETLAEEQSPKQTTREGSESQKEFTPARAAHKRRLPSSGSTPPSSSDDPKRQKPEI